MKTRTNRRWPWPACDPLTTFLCVLSAFGWAMLSVTRMEDRIYYGPAALGGLAAACTRIAVQSHRRMTARFSEQVATAVQQFKAAAEDSLRNSELVDRVTAEAVSRIATADLPERDPPPTGARSEDGWVFDPSAETLTGVVALSHMRHTS